MSMSSKSTSFVLTYFEGGTVGEACAALPEARLERPPLSLCLAGVATYLRLYWELGGPLASPAAIIRAACQGPPELLVR